MTPIFEDVLRALLISTNLCGNRVYLIRAPQAQPAPVQPYMVFTPTGPEPLHTQDGASGLYVRNYQVSIFDQSQSLALGLGDSLQAMLDGFTSGDYRGVEFAQMFFTAQTIIPEPDTQLFQVLTEWRIRFRYLATFTAVNSAVNTKRSKTA